MKWNTETTPSKGGNYLVTMDDGYVTTAEFEDQEGWILWADAGDVIGWSDLPEPCLPPKPKPYGKSMNLIKTFLEGAEALTTWKLAKYENPELYKPCILLYSNGKISGGVYVGHDTFDIDYQDADKGVTVKAWMYAPEGVGDD